MTKREILALSLIADRIDELASLENCGCSSKSKDEFKPYMSWFKCCSKDIRKMVELSDEPCRWLKSEKLTEIIRHNN